MADVGFKGLEQFNTDMQRFVEEIEIDTLTAQRKIALDVLAGVVLATPVDTGRARGNWQVTINKAPSGSLLSGKSSGRSSDKKGQRTIQKGAGRIERLRTYGRIYISNNVPYIRILNDGGFVPKNPGPTRDRRKGRRGRVLVRDGYSVQAPNGMVETTLARIQRQFK